MAFALYVVASIYTKSLDIVTIMAISTQTPDWQQPVAMYRLKSLQQCPVDRYKPSAPLTFLAAAYGDPATNKARIIELFEYFQSIGCDINAPSDHGNRALHDALIFSNLELLGYLLSRGADPALPIASGKYADMSTKDFLDLICSKGIQRCPELRVTMY